MISPLIRNPFGEVSCEDEVEVLRDKYQDFYYDQSVFNSRALETDTYLIVGRRGTGKTSLAKYFGFQTELRNAQCIDVNEPDAYDDIFRKVSALSSYSSGIEASRIRRLWDYLIWSLMFLHYRNRDRAIAAACLVVDQQEGPARIIRDILKHLLSKFIGDSKGTVADEIEGFLSSKTFEAAKDRLLAITKNEPLLVAIDTLEKYDVNDDLLMTTTSALIESASGFNVQYSSRGVHVKAFVSTEIFPHIKESVISNTTKYIKNPVYLHWRPKDLIRLICWRFSRHLERSNYISVRTRDINWDDFNGVLEKMWYPYFGVELKNARGLAEKTFPYVLRHTQMRPRQLVLLCNAIARKALKEKVFPDFKKLSIADEVKEAEQILADEVVNSYSKIYPKVAQIIDALRTSPMTFEGSYLDKQAKTTAFAWEGNYSPANFRKLVAELGIVGRVRSFDEGTGIISADFEYTISDRLALRSTDECVIHPMFYSKLQTKKNRDIIVYPFPDHPDYNHLQDKQL